MSFVTKTLTQWHLKHITNATELIVSELVTNAVKATGITDPAPRWTEITNLNVIHLRLRLPHDNSIVMELRDSSRKPPVFGPATGKEHHGYCFPPEDGKVVWCALPIPPEAAVAPARSPNSVTDALRFSVRATTGPAAVR